MSSLTPIRHLKLGTPRDGQLATLTTLPHLANLHSLEIGHACLSPMPHEFGAEGIAHLAACPQLENLRDLRLHSHGIGTDGATLIARSPHLYRLECLHLDDPHLVHGPSGLARTVATAPAMANLEELRFGQREIGSHELRLFRKANSTGPGGPTP